MTHLFPAAVLGNPYRKFIDKLKSTFWYMYLGGKGWASKSHLLRSVGLETSFGSRGHFLPASILDQLILRGQKIFIKPHF